ncbi:MAG TPA: hypothetical protein VJ844_09115 [Mucilaginibacter sp.]|nr:hypothetical protein [Mucilaginibacter sp.]
MIITKDELQHIVDTMPDKADIEEVFDKILLSSKIEQALDQLAKGQFLTSEELDEEIKKW